MPQRTFKTATTTDSLGVGPNGAVMRGRIWQVQPLLPSPLDTTAQANTYRGANTSKQIDVRAWLGIQYAQHPVGALRFKPAQGFDYPAGTHDCTAQPAVPYQTYSDELGKDGRTDLGQSNVGTYDWIGMGTRESEAIATLNIWAPSTAGPHPVVCHIHGGGWGVYHALGPQQLGHRLAAHKGCVVVTVEYPLSTFGHWPHPDLIEDGEPSTAYTFIKTALKWVHENIVAFGGDPDRVCVSGTSAGGAAVQMLLEDDETQDWFSSAWIGSGGGTGSYMGPDSWGNGYTWRTKTHEAAIRGAAAFLSSAHPDYRTVAEAIDDQGFAWAMQNAVRSEHVQAMADIGATVTAASVRAVIAGTGDLVASRRDAPENVYPFRRGVYASAIDAAKAGKFRKPFVSLWAECEALNLLGSDYTTIRGTLLALPVSTLDEWSQRLGYADYEAWLAAPWQPTGVDYPYGLESLSSAQFKRSIDALAAGCEPRRVLYTHAVFGYAAWRVARAAAETGSAAAWLLVNNFSANSIWAGHSQEVPLMFGNMEWNVGGVQDFPAATPAGLYANQRMDGLYASEIAMQMLAALAATGDPAGAYSYGGFDLFADNPPADGGSLSLDALTSYSMANAGHVNVIGKYFDPLDNLNAGTFGAGGSIVAGLDIQRDACIHYAAYMDDAFQDYLSKLEP